MDARAKAGRAADGAEQDAEGRRRAFAAAVDKSPFFLLALLALDLKLSCFRPRKTQHWRGFFDVNGERFRAKAAPIRERFRAKGGEIPSKGGEIPSAIHKPGGEGVFMSPSP